MTQLLQTMKQAIRPYVGKLLALGLIGVGVQNWRQWQRDKALADKLRVEQRSTPCLKATPKVSVLVAAWNEHTHIDALIYSFLALEYPSIELILCAGGSDGTLAKAQSYVSDRVIVLEQKRGEGKQRALAHAYTRATGDIIYLTDADCVLNTTALVRLLAPIINENEQVATGVVRPISSQMRSALVQCQWANMRYLIAYSPRYATGVQGANVALLRSIVDQTGKFSSAAPTGTDYTLGQQIRVAGYAIRCVPESVVETFFEEKVQAYITQQRRWLLNLLILGFRFQRPEHYRSAFVTMTIGTTVYSLAIGSMLAVLFRNKGVAQLLGGIVIFLQAYSFLAKVRRMFFLSFDDILTHRTLLVYVLFFQNIDFWICFSSWWYALRRRWRW